MLVICHSRLGRESIGEEISRDNTVVRSLFLGAERKRGQCLAVWDDIHTYICTYLHTFIILSLTTASQVFYKVGSLPSLDMHNSRISRLFVLFRTMTLVCGFFGTSVLSSEVAKEHTLIFSPQLSSVRGKHEQLFKCWNVWTDLRWSENFNSFHSASFFNGPSCPKLSTSVRCSTLHSVAVRSIDGYLLFADPPGLGRRLK